jgi:peptide-methionine (S)-S-oxide reductase
MKNFKHIASAVTMVTAFFLGACSQTGTKNSAGSTTDQTLNKTTMPYDSTSPQIATFGAGCFWCVEAVFQNLEGVTKVESGYSGGTTKNPTYADVCSGTTGHAEVARITFDPKKISFETLLSVFWKTHDPTTLNYQGHDHGTQYRSVIFYNNDYQKEKAEYYKKKLNEEKAYPNPVVTEITAAPEFYKAEDYHQNYYNLNKGESYCQFVIQPKVEKMKLIFGDKLKK